MARARGTVEKPSPSKATQRRVRSPCSSTRQDEGEITPAEPAVEPAKKGIRLSPRLETERAGETSSRAEAPPSSRSPKRQTHRQLRNFPAKGIDAQDGEGDESSDGHERDSETEESEGGASDGECSSEQEEDFMEDEDDSSYDESSLKENELRRTIPAVFRWIIHTVDSALADESNSANYTPKKGSKKTRRTLALKDLSHSWARSVLIKDYTWKAVTRGLTFWTRVGRTALRLPDLPAADVVLEAMGAYPSSVLVKDGIDYLYGCNSRLATLKVHYLRVDAKFSPFVKASWDIVNNKMVTRFYKKGVVGRLQACIIHLNAVSEYIQRILACATVKSDTDLVSHLRSIKKKPEVVYALPRFWESPFLIRIQRITLELQRV